MVRAKPNLMGGAEFSLVASLSITQGMPEVEHFQVMQ
jgi:hypothetical protein